MNNRKRIVLSFLAAVFFTLCFSRVAFLFFEESTTSIIDAPVSPTGNTISLVFPETATRKGARLVALKLRNESEQDRRVDLYVNSLKTGEIVLSAKSVKRPFLEPDPQTEFRGSNRLELKADGPGWVLERLEFRNFVKEERGVFGYLILPKTVPCTTPSLPIVIITFIVLFLLGLSFDWQRRLLRALLGLAGLLLIASLLFPLVSRYVFLFSIRTFLLITVLSYFQPLLATYHYACRQADHLRPQGSREIQSLIVLVIVFVFYLSSVTYQLQQFQGNYSGFLTISKKRAIKTSLLDDNLRKQLLLYEGGGGDGQYFYMMAFDPFLTRFQDQLAKYRDGVDLPPYRYRRIGFSLLTKLFSFDRPEAYPQTMILLILFSQLLAVFFLIRIALLYQQHPFWSLLYFLVPGFCISQRFGLPEPMAAAFLLGGLLFYLKQKLPLAAVFFAASLLTRETGILLVVAIATFELLKRHWKTVITICASAVPYFLWRLFLTWRLFGTWGWSGFYLEPGNVGAPFAGLVQLYSAIATGIYPPDLVLPGVLLPLLLLLVLVISLYCFSQKRDFLSLSILGYSFLALCLTFRKVWLNASNVERLSFEIFLLFVVLFLSLEEKKSFLRYAFLCFFICLFLYDLFFFSVRDFFRAGLMGLFWGRLQ